MLFPITTLTAIILSTWLIVLAFRVIGMRRQFMNNEPDDEAKALMERKNRAQGNFTEYVPIALILLLLAESQAASAFITGLAALSLIIGRFLHGYAFSFTTHWMFGRFWGMIATFSSIGLLALTNLVLLFIA